MSIIVGAVLHSIRYQRADDASLPSGARLAAKVPSERILEIAGTTHLLLETPDESRTNIAASPIESAIQRLRERIELIGIATGWKGHDLTTEFVKPACASW